MRFSLLLARVANSTGMFFLIADQQLLLAVPPPPPGRLTQPDADSCPGEEKWKNHRRGMIWIPSTWTFWSMHKQHFQERWCGSGRGWSWSFPEAGGKEVRACTGVSGRLDRFLAALSLHSWSTGRHKQISTVVKQRQKFSRPERLCYSS